MQQKKKNTVLNKSCNKVRMLVKDISFLTHSYFRDLNWYTILQLYFDSTNLWNNLCTWWCFWKILSFITSVVHCFDIEILIFNKIHRKLPFKNHWLTICKLSPPYPSSWKWLFRAEVKYYNHLSAENF